jgi:hypothetical protein
MLQGAMQCTTEARRLKHSLGLLKVLASTDPKRGTNQPSGGIGFNYSISGVREIRIQNPLKQNDYLHRG